MRQDATRDSRPESVRRGEFLILGAVILAGGLLRAAYLRSLLGWPYWRELVLSGDGRVYHLAALEILSGSPWGVPVSFQDPLYSLFLAGVMKLTGITPVGPLIVQAALGLLCALLAWAIARRVAGPAAGVVAAALVALSPVAVFHEGLLEKATLCMLLFTLAAWLLASGLARGRRARVAGAGAALAAAVLLRGNVLVVLPIALAIPIAARPRKVNAPAGVSLLLLGIAVVFGLAAFRNYDVFGDWTLAPGQVGPSFYIGNNPGNRTGTFMTWPWLRDDLRFEERDWRAEAQRRTGRLMSRGATSAFWLGEGLAFWRDHPGAAMKSFLRKGLLYLSEFDQPDTHPYLFFRRRFAPLRLPLPGMGPIVALSVLGLLASIPFWRARATEMALFLAYAASVVVFFVLGRFRLVALPLFAVFAGIAVAALVDLAGRRSFLKLSAAAAVLLAAFLVTQRGEYPEVYEWPLFNVAVRLMEQGRFEEARPLVEEGLAAHPDSAIGLELRGELALEAGDLETADRALERAAAYAPDRHSVKMALARLRDREGKKDEAMALLEEMLRADPFDAEARRARDEMRAARGAHVTLPGAAPARSRRGPE